LLASHPYASEFFFRHKVFPRLGFDAFVDRDQFVDAAYAGPYVSDAAVTDCLIERLEQASGQAQFIFAITMENHGPLHASPARDAQCLTPEQLGLRLARLAGVL
jgi:phosphoglycerol transferase MdoB-like AlkP superfamily enzyme